MIKKPKVYHIKSQDINDNENNGTEEYVFDKVRFYRDNSGEWKKVLYEEKVKKSKEEKAYFTPQRVITSTTILKPLESYYELTESEDMYIAELESNPDNINEIRNILFDNSEDNLFFGELTSLKAEFLFKKDNYYPISYEWEVKFLNKDNKKVTKLKYSGNYEKVNELKSIEIPQEIKSQLN